MVNLPHNFSKKLFLLILLLPVITGLYSSCRKSGNPAGQGVYSGQNQAGVKTSASNAKEDEFRSKIGFASRQKLVDHFEKHGGEFGGIDRDEYLRRARMLRDSRVGGDVLEAVRADGVITRYDRSTGAFIAFDSDLTIRTFFKPNDGESYFQRQSRRPVR